ncbi:MAG: nucleotide exchange factor GrpE, partial [Planctomycetota bacterium]|nr:nucleotide exchange factor GrpE [Planctomycetota bacterium]
TAGERLDPTRHEAVFSRHDDEVEENLILEVHEKGYALGEVIIRPARVAVSLGVAPVDEEAEENKDPSGD